MMLRLILSLYVKVIKIAWNTISSGFGEICNLKINLTLSEPHHVKYFFMKLVHSQAVQILDLAIALAIVRDVNMSNISI